MNKTGTRWPRDAVWQAVSASALAQQPPEQAQRERPLAHVLDELACPAH